MYSVRTEIIVHHFSSSKTLQVEDTGGAAIRIVQIHSRRTTKTYSQRRRALYLQQQRRAFCRQTNIQGKFSSGYNFWQESLIKIIKIFLKCSHWYAQIVFSDAH